MEENLALDLLSSLPDEILCRVIAYLPCESALETSFLSARWRDLWNTALVRRGTIADAATAISDFLTQFDERDPLRQPQKLRYHFCKDGVLLATIAANNRLFVDFSAGKQGFSKQFSWQLELNHQNLSCNRPSSSKVATFVKTLHLKSVSSFTCEAVSSIVSNFQFLENLKIIECDGLEALEIDASSKLLSLTILDCPQLKSLHMRSSKLKSFMYRGLLPWLWPEDHFNLKDAMLDFRQGPGDISFKSGDFDATLLTIKNAETLTLCRWTFEALIWPSISYVLSHFQFYKLKDLWWIDNYSTERYNSDALISFLKQCPSLEQLFVTIDPTSYSNPSGSATYTYSKQVNRQPELEHLKVVKMEGFRNQEDEILAEQLRKLAAMDPQIMATSNRNGSRSLVKVPLYQPKLQCGSYLERVPSWSQNGKRANKFAQAMGDQ